MKLEGVVRTVPHHSKGYGEVIKPARRAACRPPPFWVRRQGVRMLVGVNLPAFSKEIS